MKANRILELIELGKSNADKNIYALCDILLNASDYSCMPSTMEQNAFDCGVKIGKGNFANYPICLEEKEYYRIGYISKNNNSYDYANGCCEDGISVMDKDWANSHIMFYSERIATEGVYMCKGIQCGWNSDGSPNIIPTTDFVKVEKAISELY